MFPYVALQSVSNHGFDNCACQVLLVFGLSNRETDFLDQQFIGAFAKLLKATISLVTPVRPSHLILLISA
jgi:hypothetical protein